MSGSSRLRSLDALRGFDMFWIIGGDAIVHAFAEANDWPAADRAATQMSHVAWNGFRFYDLIFPLFIFISGVAMPYSLSRRVEEGANRTSLVLHALRRGLVLVALGIVYNNGLFRLPFGEMRFPSVLGRIGLAYAGAAVIVLFVSVRGQLLWFLGLVLGYWAALKLVPVPGFGTGQLTVEGNLAGAIDRAILPGRLFLDVHDPEGLFSTIPAVGTALAGALTGHFLRRKGNDGAGQASASLAVAGIAALAMGWLWGRWLPVNKNLWTGSFVCITAGWSLLLLALFHYVIDVRGHQRLAYFFTVIGANSILIYLAGHVIDFGLATDFFFGGLLNKLNDPTAEVLWQVGFIVVEWLVLWQLYKRRIFLRV